MKNIPTGHETTPGTEGAPETAAGRRRRWRGVGGVLSAACCRRSARAGRAPPAAAAPAPGSARAAPATVGAPPATQTDARAAARSAAEFRAPALSI